MTNVAQIGKSKMAQAIAIFEEIHTPGYQLNGKTQRAVFIERAGAEIIDPKTGVVNCSKHCASTYFQNISNNKNKGQPLYKYNKYKAKSKKDQAPTVGEVQAAEQQVMALLPLLEKGRWMVLDGEVEVNNFTTRDKAQQFAKKNGLVCKDRTKAA